MRSSLGQGLFNPPHASPQPLACPSTKLPFGVGTSDLRWGGGYIFWILLSPGICLSSLSGLPSVSFLVGSSLSSLACSLYRFCLGLRNPALPLHWLSKPPRTPCSYPPEARCTVGSPDLPLVSLFLPLGAYATPVLKAVSPNPQLRSPPPWVAPAKSAHCSGDGASQHPKH